MRRVWPGWLVVQSKMSLSISESELGERSQTLANGQTSNLKASSTKNAALSLSGRAVKLVGAGQSKSSTLNPAVSRGGGSTETSSAQHAVSKGAGLASAPVIHDDEEEAGKTQAIDAPNFVIHTDENGNISIETEPKASSNSESADTSSVTTALPMPGDLIPADAAERAQNTLKDARDAGSAEISTDSGQMTVDAEGDYSEDLTGELDVSKTAAIPVKGPGFTDYVEQQGILGVVNTTESPATEALMMDADSSAVTFDEKAVIPNDIVFEREEDRWQSANQYSLPSVGDTVGNYRILAELGRGTFGAVYRAENLTLGREEALKLILPSAKTAIEDMEKRFEREINIVSRLEHPNIVRLYSSGKLDHGVLWMTMELICGENLDYRLRTKGPFRFSDAQHFMMQLLSGLREAHVHQIVHRDLKPGNIMIHQKEGYPDQVVILDFGLSKGIGPEENSELQNLTQMGSKRVFGTPQYMAPEQLLRGNVGPWTDVYAAGLIFYELIVGRRAIDARTLFEVAYKQQHEMIQLPQYLHNTSIEAVIQKACAKDYRERYQNATEFYEAVRHLGNIYSSNAVSDDAEKTDEQSTVHADGRQTASVDDPALFGNLQKPENQAGSGLHRSLMEVSPTAETQHRIPAQPPRFFSRLELILIVLTIILLGGLAALWLM